MKIKMKKLLIAPLAAVIVIAGIATFAAFEAHVINVTAKIENALAVSPDIGDNLQFGTVFPQEYINNRTITVGLSGSFKDVNQIRVDTVDYKIVQKPKPKGDTETTLTAEAPIGTTTITVASTTGMAENDEIVIGYHNNMERGIIKSIANLEITLESGLTKDHSLGETVIEVYPDLCRFLSKMKGTDGIETDTQVLSYLTRDASGDPFSCASPSPDTALGQLTKTSDEADKWIIDLNVPPVDGSIGQDWPESCADWTVPEEADYGCDLWIEVTGISKAE